MADVEASSKQSLAALRACIGNIKWLLKYITNYRTCSLSCYEIGHTWTPYCHKAALGVLFTAIKYSLKIYSTLYVVTAVVKRRNAEFYKSTLWKDILRSSTFLSANAFAFVAAFCCWRRLAGFYFYPNVFVCTVPISLMLLRIETPKSHIQKGFNISSVYLPALLASFIAIILERPGRREVLALYMSNLGVETLFRMLRARKLIFELPYGEVLIFSAAVAGFMHFYRKQGVLDDFTQRTLSFIFGPEESGVADLLDFSHCSWLKRFLSFLPIRQQQAVKKLLNNKVFATRHRLCPHKQGCLLLFLQRYISLFFGGFGLHALLKLPSSLWLILSGKLPVMSWFLHKDNFSLAAFLAGLSSLHQAVSCLLRWLNLKSTRGLEGVIAGAISGLSLAHYRSSVIALSVLLKFVDVWCRHKVDKGELPRIKNGYLYLYAVTTALLFHAAVWEPHNIRPAYWKFMLSLTGGNEGTWSCSEIRFLVTPLFAMLRNHDYPTLKLLVLGRSYDFLFSLSYYVTFSMTTVQWFTLMNRQVIDRVFGTNSAQLYPDFWPQYDKRFTSLTREDLRDLSGFIK